MPIFLSIFLYGAHIWISGQDKAYFPNASDICTDNSSELSPIKGNTSVKLFIRSIFAIIGGVISSYKNSSKFLKVKILEMLILSAV